MRIITYLSAEPVIQDENGMWVVDENKAPYPFNSSMFPVMADFDAWVDANGTYILWVLSMEKDFQSLI